MRPLVIPVLLLVAASACPSEPGGTTTSATDTTSAGSTSGSTSGSTGSTDTTAAPSSTDAVTTTGGLGTSTSTGTTGAMDPCADCGPDMVCVAWSITDACSPFDPSVDCSYSCVPKPPACDGALACSNAACAAALCNGNADWCGGRQCCIPPGGASYDVICGG